MAKRLLAWRIAFAALLIPGGALAMPEPDDPVGPPSYTLMGCSLARDWTSEYVTEATGIPRAALEKAEQKFGFTPARVCASDPRLIEGMVNPQKPKPRYDEPDKWLAQRIRQMQDSNGEIPLDSLARALTQRQTLIEPPGGGTTSLAANYAEKAAGVSSGSWTWIGPGNIGGRVRALSPDPSTPGKILAGSVSGGIWMTTNTGGTWSVVDDFLPNVAVTCLVRDPSNSQTVYACTGEGFFNVDGIRGLGVFKSTNGGASWTSMACTNPSSALCAAGTPSTDWYYVNRLAVSPTNPQVILAATNNGLYRTADGGNTWTKVYQAVGTSSGVAKFRRVLDVQFHPTDGTKAILGEGKHTNCLSTCVSDGAGVAYSADGGQTWARTKLDTTAISGQLGRVEIGWSKSNPATVYAVVDQAQGKLYKSSDGGVTWTPNTPVSTPAHLSTQGWYGNAIWVDPTNDQRIIVGGVNMKMSINGGAAWTSLSTIPHVDHHVFASDPSFASNFTLYNGNDGGIYKATNANTATPGTSQPTWSSLNNNLGITQFYGGAGKGSGGRITGGAQDNGTLLWIGTTNWVRIWSSDGGDSGADQVDGNYVYGMTQFGGIVRYTQALSASPPANASQYICTGITDASCNFNNTNPQLLFIPPMAVDPTSNTTMFLGAQNLWRSTNIKDPVNTNVAWSAVRTPLGLNAYGLVPYVSAIAISPSNPDLVWIGYDDGQLACTTNATAANPTWTSVASPVSLRVTTRIAVDSTSGRIFVAFGGYLTSGPPTNGNVWKATTTCAPNPTWTNIHGQLPLAPIRAIVVHPNNPSWLYAGTEVGMFTSQDNGTNWSTTNDGPGTVSVEELFFIDPTTLVASTHGRGMFTAAVLPGTAPTITSTPPFNGSVGVAYTHNYTANGSPAPTWSVTSGTLPTGLTLNTTTGVVSGTPTTGGNFSGNTAATNTSGVANQAFSITIQAQLPGAPTIGTATAGNAQATISFTAPASNGGSPITGYVATCNPGAIAGSGGAAATSITVTGLTNGTTYTCSVRATTSAGTGPASGTVNVTPSSGITLAQLSVVSRKNHAPSGTFDLTLDTTKAINGTVTVEPRIIGAGHKIVFTFNDVITATGTAACVDVASNPCGTVSAAAVGTTVEVTLTGVADAKRVTVSLAGVNGTLNTSVSLGFLLGDVNNSYSVTSSDILAVNGRVGQAASASNFLYDVNVSGGISSNDVVTVKQQSGQLLP